MRSSRWNALGNVYVLTDEPVDRARAVELSRGADGVVEVLRSDGREADVVIWNPDGSTAELSGNGTRIAARWLHERGGRREVTIRTPSRAVHARILPDGRIEQDVGSVCVLAREVVAGVEVVPVSVGNPHAVVTGDPADLPAIGPLLERHVRFPERTNVEVARVDAPGYARARVWERGVGETRSSGTGAVAVAAATHSGGTVVVAFPGGELEVRLADDAATLVGPAERVA